MSIIRYVPLSGLSVIPWTSTYVSSGWAQLIWTSTSWGNNHYSFAMSCGLLLSKGNSPGLIQPSSHTCMMYQPKQIRIRPPPGGSPPANIHQDRYRPNDYWPTCINIWSLICLYPCNYCIDIKNDRMNSGGTLRQN